MSDYGFTILPIFKSLVTMALFITVLTISSSINTSTASHDGLEFMPMKNSKEFRVMDMAKARDEILRRRLGKAYQQCSPCKCCNGTTCTTIPCCYTIDCLLPGKPYGTCAFVPKSCNCTNCT